MGWVGGGAGAKGPTGLSLTSKDRPAKLEWLLSFRVWFCTRISSCALRLPVYTHSTRDAGHSRRLGHCELPAGPAAEVIRGAAERQTGRHCTASS